MPRVRFRLPLYQRGSSEQNHGVGPSGPDEVVAARFLQDFHCVGGACEDVCCRDWLIAYDRPSYDRLRVAMGKTPEGRKAFSERLVLGDGTQPGGAHAYIQPKPDGWCPFLADDKRCEIQVEYGEAMLSETCSVFPRTATAAGRRVELGGSLSCPEVARHLLPTEGAGDLVPVHPGHMSRLMPRKWVGRRVNIDGGKPYEQAFDVVRTTILTSLADTAVPFTWSRVAIADVARTVSPYFYREAVFVDADRLERDLQRLEDRSSVLRLGRDFDTIAPPLEPTLQLIVTLLQQRLTLPHSDRYARLVGKVFTSLQAEAGVDDQGAVPLNRLAGTYRRRRDELTGRYESRTELLFRNYALQHWRRHPYTSSRTLLEHVCKLEFRLAVVRLLFAGHPDIALLLATDLPEQEADAILNRVAVEVIQVFVKAYEHTQAFMEAAEAALDRVAPPSFGRAVVLARF